MSGCVSRISASDREQVTVFSTPLGKPASASNSGYGPYFGSVPDMSEVAGGFRLADVRDGGPAAKAGLKAGDIMYEFAGTPIKNLYDFSQALRMHKPGDEVVVKWRRDGQEMEGKTVLTTRH